MSKKKRNGPKKALSVAQLDALLDNEVGTQANPPLMDTGDPLAEEYPVSSGPVMRKCWPHPLLEIREGLPPVAGSACRKPVFDGCHIYIGFESGMTLTARQFPWTKGHEIQYLIPDMGVPGHPESFIKLVEWTLGEIEKGARVHAGCIGGHGRTGMFFAALVAKATGRKDAIKYVREAYCEKAVESEKQIKFLMEHFGVDSAPASKKYSEPTHNTSGAKQGWWNNPKEKGVGSVCSDEDKDVVNPVPNGEHIWGETFSEEDY